MDLLAKSPHYMNPCHEYEIYLRGNKIPAIENFGVLRDKYDSIDLSDNEIRKFDNFPMMLRATSFLLNNNLISKVGESIGKQVVNLNSLVLTNNKISDFSEIDNLATCKKLEYLALVDNPVIHKLYYRLYTIYKIPSLRFLDFQKVKKSEREAANSFFESEDGKAYLASGAISASKPSSSSSVVASTKAQKDYIRELISEAKSLAEIDAIEKSLREGTFNFPAHLRLDGESSGAVAAEKNDAMMEVGQN